MTLIQCILESRGPGYIRVLDSLKRPVQLTFHGRVTNLMLLISRHRRRPNRDVYTLCVPVYDVPLSLWTTRLRTQDEGENVHIGG